jgi:hypothetical protein
VGRPTRFTPERRERFFAALATGVFPETAARHAGWSPATFYRILGGTSPDHVAFREDVLRAETDLELRLAGTVTQAAFRSARLALALLERRFSEHWGRRAGIVRPPEEPARPGPESDEVLILDPSLVEAIVSKLLAARTGRSGPTGPAERVSRFADHGARRKEEEP